MPHNQRLFLTLSFCVLMLPGCQAFKSKLSSMSKLPSSKSLAFWKKDSDSLPPPPPSRHLSPSSNRDQRDEQLAESNTPGINIEEYRQEIDRRIDGTRGLVNDFVSKGTKRSPYSMDDASDGQTPSGDRQKDTLNANRSFAPGGGFSGLAGAELDEAQKRFSDSIANVEEPLNQINRSGFKSPREMFSSDPTSAVEDAITKSKSGFQSTVAGSGSRNPLAKVNNSLYDMNGNLAAATENVSKAAESTLGAARQKVDQAFGSMTEGAREVAKNSEKLAGKLKDRLASVATKATPSFGNGGGFKSPFSGNSGGATSAVELEKPESNVAGVNSGFGFPQSAHGMMQSQDQNSGFNRLKVADVTPVESRGFQNSAGSSISPPQKPFGANATESSQSNNGFRTASAQNNQIFKNTQPIASEFGRGENKPASYVSDVDLPAKLLKGSSSYAPGSVHLIR